MCHLIEEVLIFRLMVVVCGKNKVIMAETDHGKSVRGKRRTWAGPPHRRATRTCMELPQLDAIFIQTTIKPLVCRDGGDGEDDGDEGEHRREHAQDAAELDAHHGGACGCLKPLLECFTGVMCACGCLETVFVVCFSDDVA